MRIYRETLPLGNQYGFVDDIGFDGDIMAKQAVIQSLFRLPENDFLLTKVQLLVCLQQPSDPVSQEFIIDVSLCKFVDIKSFETLYVLPMEMLPGIVPDRRMFNESWNGRRVVANVDFVQVYHAVLPYLKPENYSSSLIDSYTTMRMDNSRLILTYII